MIIMIKKNSLKNNNKKEACSKDKWSKEVRWTVLKHEKGGPKEATLRM